MTSTAPTTHQSLPSRWKEVLTTTNPPASGEMDVVSRWLFLTRAAVLPMTLTAGLVAGLLAVHADDFNAGWFALAFLGILLAHTANNLMNDLFDSTTGLDKADYPRAMYSPHPVLEGYITKRGLATAAIVVNLVDAGVGVVLVMARGWPVIAFALAGFLLSAAYTAPPLRLKKRGLGEPDVFVVWGPLMVGGVYYSAVGSIPWEVYAASVPYGLLCTTVLMGKHVDKAPWDEREGIRTLPVILGDTRARPSPRDDGRLLRHRRRRHRHRRAALARRRRGRGPADAGQGLGAVVEPKPAEPPKGFPIWPLWYAAIAFLHTRRAGALLVLGLLVAAVAGIEPGFLS